MTTKEQELKALAQIKKIVSSLGEYSYIGIAFEGCFEIAETNIQNDWECSMKQRAESAETKAEELREELKQTEGLLQARTAMLNRIDSEAAEKIQAMEKKILSADDMIDLKQLAYNAAYEADQESEQAAADIVKYADDPSGDSFRNAVKLHRATSNRREYLTKLHNRISEICEMNYGAY